MLDAHISFVINTRAIAHFYRTDGCQGWRLGLRAQPAGQLGFLFCVGLKKYLLCCRVPTLSYGVQTGVEWEARKRKRNGSIGVLTADIIKTNLNSRNLKQAAMYTYQMR